jgi:hypothetical protein
MKVIMRAEGTGLQYFCRKFATETYYCGPCLRRKRMAELKTQIQSRSC